jgi:hypothetical protein
MKKVSGLDENAKTKIPYTLMSRKICNARVTKIYAQWARGVQGDLIYSLRPGV